MASCLLYGPSTLRLQRPPGSLSRLDDIFSLLWDQEPRWTKLKNSRAKRRIESSASPWPFASPSSPHGLNPYLI
ncbi:hypothetical protein ACRALDRAFT_2031502 [Sodiomyces alcalophilus JCM 7366]|uniref:uncharacterized protein n=1 Tax=Sodiomyces alcalophilus JCM 7366 TaxID=591952 RepID=UPI0039B4A207